MSAYKPPLKGEVTAKQSEGYKTQKYFPSFPLAAAGILAAKEMRDFV